MTEKHQSSWAGLVFMIISSATVYATAYSCTLFALAPPRPALVSECVRETAIKLRATREDYLSGAEMACRAAAAVAGH
jgi:hypothetical protein